jgi:hypothetical protein
MLHRSLPYLYVSCQQRIHNSCRDQFIQNKTSSAEKVNMTQAHEVAAIRCEQKSELVWCQPLDFNTCHHRLLYSTSHKRYRVLTTHEVALLRHPECAQGQAQDSRIRAVDIRKLLQQHVDVVLRVSVQLMYLPLPVRLPNRWPPVRCREVEGLTRATTLHCFLVKCPCCLLCCLEGAKIPERIRFMSDQISKHNNRTNLTASRPNQGLASCLNKSDAANVAVCPQILAPHGRMFSQQHNIQC